MTFAHFFSWTDNARTRHFSGKGRYEITFDVPNDYLSRDLRLFLDLGRVANIAEVELNGTSAGIVWMRGQTLEVTGILCAGTNTMTVLVTNTLINRISGISDPDRLGGHNWYSQHFNSLPASGLLGPVRIVAKKTVNLTGE
jgi:hypothetical protein